VCPADAGRNFWKTRVLRKNKWWRIVGPAAAVTVVTGAALYFHAVYDAATAPAASASAVASAIAALGSADAAALPAAPGTDPQAPKDVLKKSTLADAIAFAKPFMSDTIDRLDEGSALLALWSSQHLTWAELSALPETTAADFQKDPDAERGKRLCVKGTIVEIRAERTLAQRMIDDHAQQLISATQPQPATSAVLDPSLIEAGVAGDAGTAVVLPLGSTSDDWKIPKDGKVFIAIVTTTKQPKSDGGEPPAPILVPTSVQPNAPPPLIAEAIAVKSSGDLVNGSTANVCGVLTGMNRHTNPTDSTTVDTHRLIGMFDLPENRNDSSPSPKPDKPPPKG
jgi:hypothetical protein